MTAKEIYLMHAKLIGYKNRVQRARSIIHAALLASKRSYASCSWGKDSIVMLHLIMQELPGIDVLNIICGEYDDWPDTSRVQGEFLKRFKINLHIENAMPVTECYRMAGGFYVFPETEIQKEADRLYSRSFIEAIDRFAEEIGADLAFIGLRAEESKRRWMLLKSRGDTFYAKTRGLVECFPLAGWSGRDIWAYIFSNDLPYLDLYDLADDRERARNGAAFAANVPVYGGEAHYNGQLALLKHWYPDLFNRFAAEFPDVRNYI